MKKLGFVETSLSHLNNINKENNARQFKLKLGWFSKTVVHSKITKLNMIKSLSQ